MTAGVDNMLAYEILSILGIYSSREAGKILNSSDIQEELGRRKIDTKKEGFQDTFRLITDSLVHDNSIKVVGLVPELCFAPTNKKASFEELFNEKTHPDPERARGLMQEIGVERVINEIILTFVAGELKQETSLNSPSYTLSDSLLRAGLEEREVPFSEEEYLLAKDLLVRFEVLKVRNLLPEISFELREEAQMSAGFTGINSNARFSGSEH